MTYTIQIPKFGIGSVPLSLVARVYGKDATWVKQGIIDRWLPIGYATRDKKLVQPNEPMDAMYGRMNFYISPKKLWEDTGYIWEGEADDNKSSTGAQEDP